MATPLIPVEADKAAKKRWFGGRRWDSTTGSSRANGRERPRRRGGASRARGRAAGTRAGRGASVDPYAELKTRVHHACIAKLGPQLFSNQTTENLTDQVMRAVTEQLALDRTPLTREERRQITREIADDILGYGPLEPYLRDDSVTEVMVNTTTGSTSSAVARSSRRRSRSSTTRTSCASSTRSSLRSAAGSTRASPMVDARLPDGSRVNAIIPPLALRGPDAHDPEVLARPVHDGRPDRFRVGQRQGAHFLSACVKGKLNVLISGGTGTGKTTMLNALSAFIPDDERIVTIEDAAELQLQQEHVITLESRPANIEGKGEVRIRELVRNSLRMRPDRIIVGEVRGPEALDMLQAMNTGHEGSLTTIHANSPRDALSPWRRSC